MNPKNNEIKTTPEVWSKGQYFLFWGFPIFTALFYISEKAFDNHGEYERWVLIFLITAFSSIPAYFSVSLWIYLSNLRIKKENFKIQEWLKKVVIISGAFWIFLICSNPEEKPYETNDYSKVNVKKTVFKITGVVAMVAALYWAIGENKKI
jgi:hypothetical protein